MTDHKFRDQDWWTASVALLIDSLIGLSLLLVNLLVAAVCETVARASGGRVSMDAMWYGWIVTAKESLDGAQVEKALKSL